MLLLRPFLALVAQAVFAIIFVVPAAPDPWRRAADWWLVSFAVAELVNLWFLWRLARGEGIRWRDLYNLGGRGRLGGDLKWTAVALVVAGPIAFLPNLALGAWLWGDAQAGADLIFRSVPLWAAWFALLLFPAIHALTELPTYFGYVMPRLQLMLGSRIRGLAVCALVLSAQHALLPLLFDWRFILWRSFMFLGFAFWVGWVIDRRPTALPYLAGAHYLLDLSLPIFVLVASV